MLKITHLPFVALIWAYERARRLVSYGTQKPLAKLYRPQFAARPLSASQPSLDHDRAATKATNRTAATQANTISASGAVNGSALSNAEMPDLIALVQKLSDQVEALTAMVAEQKAD